MLRICSSSDTVSPGEVACECTVPRWGSPRPGGTLPGFRREMCCAPSKSVEVSGAEQPFGNEWRRGRHVQLGFRGVPKQMPQVVGDGLGLHLLGQGRDRDL